LGFQKSNGLERTATLDQQTADALKSARETDSPLDGTGFEPPVPLLQKAVPGPRRDAGTIAKPFKVGFETAMVPRGTLPQPFRSRWDREFESVFLQR
jgi:hypothetical protein